MLKELPTTTKLNKSKPGFVAAFKHARYYG